MKKIKINKKDFTRLREIAENWAGERWLHRDFLTILWENDIVERPDDDFLAGGVDHIEFTRRSFTVHDRCLSTSSGTLDGTTKFISV